MTEAGRAYAVLVASTLAFGVCFAVWMMNGVLVTYLVGNRVFDFDQAQVGWLIGLPVLTGSVLRLPAGLLTDRFGGRPMFVAVMLASAAAAWLTSYANGFWAFAAGGLAFGLAGASFAVGIAYVSLFFPKERQGTALGIFGMGTAGAAATSFFAPLLLERLTAAGAELDAWRLLPRYYAALLALTTVAFWLLTTNRRPQEGASKSLAERMAPLRVERVWRFGLYYLLVFGGFVALSQWLIPYYVNVYGLAVTAAGALAAAFSFPSGVFRVLGGWLSDRHGPRKVMYGVLAGCAVCTLLLAVPRMDVYSPGEGVMAAAPGTVEDVSPSRVVVAGTEYRIRERGPRPPEGRDLARGGGPARRLGRAPPARRARRHARLLPGEPDHLHRDPARARHPHGRRDGRRLQVHPQLLPAGGRRRRRDRRGDRRPRRLRAPDPVRLPAGDGGAVDDLLADPVRALDRLPRVDAPRRSAPDGGRGAPARARDRDAADRTPPRGPGPRDGGARGQAASPRSSLTWSACTRPTSRS